MLDWLLNALNTSRNQFQELADDIRCSRADANAWSTSGCASMAWQKCYKYYTKADTELTAYYAAIVLHPQLKKFWFETA
jgi:hypothetical protein